MSKQRRRRRNDTRQRKEEVQSNTNSNAYLSGLTQNQINDIGSIPWGYPAGRPQDLLSRDATLTDENNRSMVAPGIMVIKTVFGPGRTWGHWSPVNQAAMNQMTYLRSHNSRNDSHYQASDLILMEMALESAFVLYTVLKRAYYVSTRWEETNRYTPDLLLQSMGFNAKDFRKHRVNIRSILDQFCIALGSYPLPSNLEIFRRHLTLFSNLYEDSESCKAQYYLFKPYGFYIYDEWRRDLPKSEVVRPGKATFVHWHDMVKLKWYASSGEYGAGWGLDPDTASSDFWTYDDIVEIIEFITSLFLESSDIMRMGSDIRRAYENNLWYLDELDRDKVLEPCKDKEALLLIHNSRAYPVLDSTLDIEQTATGLETGDALIQWAPKCFINFANANQFYTHNPLPLVDTWEDQPDPASVVMSTRMMPTLIEIDVKTGQQAINCSTMFPAGYESWRLNADNSYFVNTFTSWLSSFTPAVLGDIEKYDWHPHIYYYQYNGEGKITNYVMFGDLDSFATFDFELAERQNEVDIISQWRIPEMEFYT